MSITKEQVLENLDDIKKILAELDFPAKTEEIKYFEIKNRWTGSVIYRSTKTTWKEVVKEAIESGANLTRANLTGADLTDADLTRANLTRADLTGANLTGADLTRANLTGANLTRANLTGADLTGADLTDADLTAVLFYFGNGNKNFEALCKAIKTIKHPDGTFDQLCK